MGQKNKTVDDLTSVQGAKPASQNELRELIARQQYCCALTGVSLCPEDAQLDHVVAIANGGDNSIGNMQVVHKTINAMKGTLSNRELITWCRMVATHADISSGSLDARDSS
jgi:5-methylcytosine-specific restriction endonuclease McrA